MSKTSFITKRHRILALAGAAIIAAPMVFGLALQGGHAQAATAQLIPASLQALPSYADIVSADKPAVVTITTKIKQQPDNSSDMQQFGPGSPYDQFFRQFFGDNGPMPPVAPQHNGGQVAEALGSGFIVSSDGTIVTNNHVIDGASDIKVTLDDGSEYTGKLVGRDTKTDLAVVKIDAGKALPTVAWGDSDKLRVGDGVLAMGNPFGIGTTVTSGIVSARGRDLHNGPYDDFIQVDAAINHGNSGGPLVDAEGKVVGINTAIYSPNGGNVGVGFAIPSDQAQTVVAKLMTSGSIEHGYIGVQIQPVTKDVADAIGLAKASGALVSKVVQGTPAADAGVKTGDVVTAFSGKPVDNPRDLSRLVADAAPGAKDTITVWRQGKQVDLSIAVGQNGEDNQASAAPQDGVEPGSSKLAVPELGLGLAEITSDMRQAYGIGKSVHGGIVASVDPDKAAADRGIQQGDIVVSVNQEKTNSARQVVDAIKSAEKEGRKSVLLEVERGSDQVFVGLPIGHA